MTYPTAEEALAALVRLTVSEPERIRFMTCTYGPVMHLRVYWSEATTDDEAALTRVLPQSMQCTRHPGFVCAIGDVPMDPGPRP